MVLRKDLYDIYGDLIAKKGQRITHYLINNIKKMPKKNSVKKALKHTFIYNDVKKVLRDPKYRVIFSGEINRKHILEAAGNTVFEDGIIRELAWMKKHQPYTYNHELVVGPLTIKMAYSLKKYNLDPKIASYAAFTHDLGKTRIPKKTLEKTTALTVDEYELLRTHSGIGYLLLMRYAEKQDLKSALAAYQHHERLDGSGYPDGRRKINVYAELVAANDVLDALLSKRPYRKKSYSLRAALDYLLDEVREKRLNKDVVYTLISYARKSKPDIKNMRVSTVKRDRPPKATLYGKIVHKLLHW